MNIRFQNDSRNNFMNTCNNKYYQTLLLTLTLLIVHSSLLIATVRFVSKTGSSTPPYLTWETSADSIQKCINICVFGDTIYVANGVYQEQVVMIDGLSMIGAGMDSCVIDSRQLVTLQNYKTIDMKDSCLVKGFYIRSTNNFDYGHGIDTEGQTTGLIVGNKFSNANTAILLYDSNVEAYKNLLFNVRFGIYLVNSYSIVRQNHIIMDVQGVTAIRVEGFTSSYAPIIDSNYIDNVYDTGIYKFISSSPTIKNNIIRVKYSTGIRLAQGGTAKVYNNIIINSGYIGIDYFANSYVLIHNNYVQGKQGSDGIKVWSNGFVINNIVTNTSSGITKYSSQNPVVQYNNSWNNEINYDDIIPDSTNLSVDPMIMNNDTTQGNLDFHLQKFSPLIDAGDPTILDRDGSRSDIGLYGGPYGWTYTYNDLAPRPPHNVTAAIEDGLVKLTWNKNTEADFSHYRIYRDTLTIVIYDSSKIVGETPDTVFYDNLPPATKETRFYYVITAFDNQGNQSYPSEEINVLVTGLGEYPPKGYDGYRLLSNYPNPFNPSTIIPYRLKEGGYVKLYVYDVKGELVRVLVNEWQERGYYEVMFNPNREERSRANSFEVPMGKTYSDIATGVYLYMIQVYNDRNIPVFSDSGKMILLK
jgi:parallel beta-helix repeat protein